MSVDVNFIVSTVLAAHQVGATPQQRAAEVQLFYQLKNGDVGSSAEAGAELIQPSRPLEAQMMGYGVLQHLVGNRWDQLSPGARNQLAALAYSLVQQTATSGDGFKGCLPWVIRSKAALLLALAIKRSGPDFLDSSLNQLLSQASGGPAAMQETVCLVLHYFTDEVVQFTEDMAGDELRHMVARLTAALPAVLRFVEQTLEVNFAALEAAGPHAIGEVVAPHKYAVQAALGAAQSFAEWVPVNSIRESGLVVASGFMLGATAHPDFQMKGCNVLLTLAGRKRTAEEEEQGFDSAMQDSAAALMRSAEALLAPEAVKELGFEGDSDEFGQAVCEALAMLGSTHLAAALPTPPIRLRYLHVMLAFAQHTYLPLADKALGLWAKLLQDAAVSAAAAAKPSTTGSMSPPSAGASSLQVQREQRNRHAYLPPEAVMTLMQLAAEQLHQRNPQTPHEDDEFPPYFDSFEDYREFMIGYRLKLSSIVKSTAAVLPQQALQAASERLAVAIAATGGGHEEARGMLASAVVFLEATLKAVWDATSEPSDRATVVRASEPMFQSLLALQVSDPTLLQNQARGLEAFSRIVASKPELVLGTVGRLFDLLVGCIPLEPGGHLAPPSKPLPGWRDGFLARANVAMVFVEYAKTGPQAFLPHLETIARRLSDLGDASQLRPGERNTVTEALLAASIAGTESLQASLAEWALGRIRTTWASSDFEESIASPEAFMARYLPTPRPAEDASGPHVAGAHLRWSLYHDVHMIERSIRRMQDGGSATSHPLTPHMAWAVPVLLRLVACLNAVYSPAGRAALGAAAPALDMSPQEKALYLRRVGPGSNRRQMAVAASAATHDDDADRAGDYSSSGGTTVSSIRVWMRHIREFAFHALGMLPTHVPPSLELPGIAPGFAPSTWAYIDTLDHQHVRIVLRHVSIPYLKTLKTTRAIETWVLPGLALLAPHMQQRLSAGWAALAPSSNAPPGVGGGAELGFRVSTGSAAATDDEIIADRMLRELTQEYADLLREVSTRTHHVGGTAPDSHKTSSSPAHFGGTPSSTIPSEARTQQTHANTILELLLEREPAAGIAAATAAVEGMQRMDDAAYRFALFCRALVTLAPRDPLLYSYVGSEILQASIRSLAFETMASHQADILGLIRSILVQQVGDGRSAVHGVLQTMLAVTPERESEFAASLLALKSEKDQRNAVKKLLVEACGSGSLAALADWRPPTVVAYGAALKQRGTRGAATKDRNDEQLQGDITRALLP